MVLVYFACGGVADMSTRVMHRCIYPLCRYSGASSFSVEHHNAHFPFKKRHLNIMHVPQHVQYRTTLVEADYHYEKDAYGVSQDPCIVNAHMSVENTNSCFLHWTEVILKLHDSFKDKHGKRIVDLLLTTMIWNGYVSEWKTWLLVLDLCERETMRS